MAENDGQGGGFSLFGFEVKRKSQGDKEQANKLSFVAPTAEDGTGQVINAGGYYGSYVDMGDGSTSSDTDLIYKYRDLAQNPECDAAVEDIVNEAIVSDDASAPVQINLDDLDEETVSDKIKDVIYEEFNNVVELLDFNFRGHDIFRRWYIDGKIYYHKIVDPKNPKKGILEVRYIDPTKIRKVREVKEEYDEKTRTKMVKGVNEYFIYQNKTLTQMSQGLKISPDAITYVTSGVTDASRKRVLSYLHKALKPVNQLRMMEDSLVIYRLSRAPERRIFYIDVGNLPKGKAEEYMRNIMSKYRNKMVYDANTGELRDDRKHMSMLEDFWLPRKEGGRGTEISTLPGGENLGQIDDIVYFQKQLYKSLNVPTNRLEQDTPFSMGRATEITRDELKFQKFINRLRKKFSHIFMDMLKTQLIAKGVVNEKEWKEISQKMRIDFMQDNHFSELKQAELIQDRMNILRDVQEHVGRYYSEEWVRKNILQQTEEEIERMDKQIKDEISAGKYKDPSKEDDMF
mgnify:CR=1 FL=1